MSPFASAEEKEKCSMEFLKRMVLMVLIAPLGLAGGCATTQTESVPGVPTAVTPHPECKVLHAPPMPDGMTPDSLLIWTGPQPSLQHVSIWLSPLELQKIAQFRQASAAFPSLKGQLDYAEEQVRLWTAEPDSPHRNSQLRQWIEERDRLKEQFGQLSLLLGQQPETVRPMPFQPPRK